MSHLKKICNGPLHFKVFLLAIVIAPRLQINLMGKEKLLSKNIKFNDPFDLKALHVANCYNFKCRRVAKVKNGGRIQ